MKPCPFRCAGDELRVHWRDAYAHIRCWNCGAEGPKAKLPEEAERLWDERVTAGHHDVTDLYQDERADNLRIKELEALLRQVQEDATGKADGEKRIWPVKANLYRAISKALETPVVEDVT